MNNVKGLSREYICPICNKKFYIPKQHPGSGRNEWVYSKRVKGKKYYMCTYSCDNRAKEIIGEVSKMNIQSEFDYIKQQYVVFGQNRLQMIESAERNMEMYNKLHNADNLRCECVERFKDCIHDFYDSLEGDKR